jgi:hypothetical protein
LSERAHIGAARAAGTTATRRRALGEQPFASLQRNAGNRAVQRLASDALAAVDGVALSERIGAVEGGGSSLDGSLRQRVTETLGADPGDIRIHADGEGHELSQALGAKAFTSGQDIFFQSGTFDPSTPEGFELLVHESTHVLQQAAGPVAGNETADGALAISDPGDAFEQAASSAAEAPAPAGPSAEGRPVQRWPDVDDLLGVAEQNAKGPGPAVDMLGSFTSAISDDASSGNLGMGTVKKIAATEEQREAAKGAELSASQKGFDSDVDAATKWMGGGSVDRFAGGMAKEVFGMGVGLESMIQNPIGFEKGQAEKQSKEALPMVTNQYFDTLGKVSRGEEGLGGAASDLYGAFTKGKDNEWAAKQAAAQPIVNDINKGDYAGAFGRFGAEVGVAVLGMGEEGPLGEVSAEAPRPGEVPVAGEVPAVPPDPVPLPDPGPAPVPEGPSTLPGVAPDANIPNERVVSPQANSVPGEELEPPTLRDDPDQPPVTLRTDPDLAPPTFREPVPQISPLNPKFAEPGSPGFIEQADPLADTQRPPFEIDPGADSAVDTRPQVTQRGLGDELPQTRRGLGPEVEPLGEPAAPGRFSRNAGPPTLRDAGPPDFGPPDFGDGPATPGDSPLAHSVATPGGGAIGPAPAGEIGPLGGPPTPGELFGPAPDLNAPLPDDPIPGEPAMPMQDPWILRREFGRE